MGLKIRLRKILTYDVFRTLSDLFNFIERKEGKIILLSMIYMYFITMMTYFLAKLILFDYQIAIIVYLLSVVINAAFLDNKFNKYTLFLSKNPHSIISRLLHALTGPYGILKFLYIIACLSVLANQRRETIKLILAVPAAEFSQRKRADHSLLNSIAKYQKRLRDYS